MLRTFRVYNPELNGDEEIETILSKEDGEDQYREIRAEQIGDEYHSMHELYEHRMALNIALFNFMYGVDKSIRGDYIAGGSNHLYMKSKFHADGTMFDGYFIVMAITPEGQISYHYKLEHWDKFKIPEVDKTPIWDGHNSNDVIERLIAL